MRLIWPPTETKTETGLWLEKNLSNFKNGNLYYLIIYISVKCKIIPTTLHWWSQHHHDHEWKYGKVDMDTKYPDVNDESVKSSDIAKTLETIKYDDDCQ